MPDRQRLIDELQGPDDVGVLLMAQMGGVPNELQLFIQAAVYDEAAQGLRDKNGYMVRVLGVQEHRMSLGLFGSMFMADEHPILLHHNDPKLVVHFEGQASDINELVLDIHQAHASTFGPWRELAGDINWDQPLVDLLKSGGGVLGTMPKTAAEHMVRVFEHHGMSAHLEGVSERDDTDEHGRSTLWKLLGIGDSYFVALDFTVDVMGQRPK